MFSEGRVCSVILRVRIQFDIPKLNRLQWVLKRFIPKLHFICYFLLLEQ